MSKCCYMRMRLARFRHKCTFLIMFWQTTVFYWGGVTTNKDGARETRRANFDCVPKTEVKFACGCADRALHHLWVCEANFPPLDLHNQYISAKKRKTLMPRKSLSSFSMPFSLHLRWQGLVCLDSSLPSFIICPLSALQSAIHRDVPINKLTHKPE